MSGKMWRRDEHCHYTRDALHQCIDRRTDETRCESNDTYLLGAGVVAWATSQIFLEQTLAYERDQARIENQ